MEHHELLGDLGDVDAHSQLGGLGSLEIGTPTVDIDGDGTLDTSIQTGPNSLFVLTDTDHDGYADHLTVVDDDGDFSAWDYHHNPNGAAHWEQIDHGKVGE